MTSTEARMRLSKSSSTGETGSGVNRVSASPSRQICAPQSCKMAQRVSTSVRWGTPSIRSGSRVKSPAHNMGSTAFFAVCISSSPRSRSAWRIR